MAHPLAQLVEHHRARILALARQHGANAIMLFGSVATGQEHSASDIDFLVDMQPGTSLFNLGGLQYELGQLLQHDVDLVALCDLDAADRGTILNQAQPL